MKPGAMWPMAIVGVLALTVGANVFLLYAAHDKDAAVIEHDYYSRAVAWDSLESARAKSAALHWQAGLVAGARTARGVPLVLRLSDAAGSTVAGSGVHATAVHNTDPAHPVRVEFVETSPGTYVAEPALPHDGLWEFDVSAVRGADRYLVTLRTDVAR